MQQQFHCRVISSKFDCVSLLFPPAEEVSLRPSSKASLHSSTFPERLFTVPEMPGPDGPDCPASVVTEQFISEENISNLEKSLDLWTNNIKVCDRLHVETPFFKYELKCSNLKLTLQELCLLTILNLQIKIPTWQCSTIPQPFPAPLTFSYCL